MPACVWVSVDEDGDAADAALAAKLAFYGGAFAPYLLERAGLAREDFAPAAAAQLRGDTAGAAGLITPAMLRLGIAGTPDDVADRCGALLDHGATHLSFGPPLAPTRCGPSGSSGATSYPDCGPGRHGRRRRARRRRREWSFGTSVSRWSR